MWLRVSRCELCELLGIEHSGVYETVEIDSNNNAVALVGRTETESLYATKVETIPQTALIAPTDVIP